MKYRVDKKGNQLSILGFGCMRFTQTLGKIDINKAESEIMKAYEAGVNYFDTAYIYPGSEAAIGEIFEKNKIRDKIYIATKLPHYMLKSKEDFDKYFNEELKRLRTDYVDYYLMHMLTDAKTWERLVDMGIKEWIENKMASGQIRNIGFSYHGGTDAFCKLIDCYDWDFCQIQYNYLDEHSQAGRAGLKYAASKGIPVVIMEPLRGGRLVNNLPSEASKLIEKNEHKWTPAEWAFRWLWDQEEVTVILSGMNSIPMVEENTKIASSIEANTFTEDDFNTVKKITEAIIGNTKVGCTGCRYCMPCPKGVDIPGVFAAYNRQASDGKMNAFREYFMCTTLRKEYTGPANCVECGLCEKHCPQHIEIRNELKNARKSLETPLYKIARKVAPKVMKY
ncbi:MAG: aldo/keto reductase [Clostridia bacterium]|nr:aldo/keto reductase [Clostridia bacterium]